MKIYVRVKPNSKNEKVEAIDAYHYKVSVKEPATEGRANWGVVRVLAEYFNVAPSRISIISGQTSRDKMFEIV